ncbi:MAG: hypothetical protein LUG52_10245 [Clostridia bacterium]|nr:hypothetical protein [Clostridia bacterium]
MKHCIVNRPLGFSSFAPLLLILVATIVLSSLASIVSFSLSLVILVVGVVILCVLTPRYIRCEYEYSLEGDAFSVALIMNKSSRKELFSSDMEQLIVCENAAGKNVSSTRTVSAIAKSGTAYRAEFSCEEGTASVIFTPSEEFLKEMRLYSPSKFHL